MPWRACQFVPYLKSPKGAACRAREEDKRPNSHGVLSLFRAIIHDLLTSAPNQNGTGARIGSATFVLVRDLVVGLVATHSPAASSSGVRTSGSLTGTELSPHEADWVGCGNSLRSAKPGLHSVEVVLGTRERFGPEPEHDGHLLWRLLVNPSNMTGTEYNEQQPRSSPGLQSACRVSTRGTNPSLNLLNRVYGIGAQVTAPHTQAQPVLYACPPINGFVLLTPRSW